MEPINSEMNLGGIFFLGKSSLLRFEEVDSVLDDIKRNITESRAKNVRSKPFSCQATEDVIRKETEERETGRTRLQSIASASAPGELGISIGADDGNNKNKNGAPVFWGANRRDKPSFLTTLPFKNTFEFRKHVEFIAATSPSAPNSHLAQLKLHMRRYGDVQVARQDRSKADDVEIRQAKEIKEQAIWRQTLMSTILSDNIGDEEDEDNADEELMAQLKSLNLPTLADVDVSIVEQ
jgi:hypothetical protein